ncbi:hypothetical protein IV102_24700 [bacterium]|nr:hypothetical protein [bacterium]
MTVPDSPEMLGVAQRVMWSCKPHEALQQPYLFLAHVMTYGLTSDVVFVRKTLGLDAFREALEHAPAGIFDPRSWSYWHLICGQSSPPPLPERQL